LRKLTRIPEVIDTTRKYEHILSDDEVWPVVRMARNRKEFMDSVIGESFERLKKLRPNLNALIDELELTRYQGKAQIQNQSVEG
jgi:glycerol-3-phosphate O-acyltransferase